jgi:RimJ/RimL family protein N-acetyltransferase
MDEDVVRRSLGKYLRPEAPVPGVKAAERSKRPQVSLAPFDREFFETIPNRQRVHPPNEANNMVQYRTILANGEKAGVIGMLLARNDCGLLQDVLVPEWQGHGVLRPALRLICKELQLRKVLATIKTTNLRSRQAHEGIGFKPFGADAMKQMRKSKWLPEDSVRYYLNVPKEWRRDA